MGFQDQSYLHLSFPGMRPDIAARELCHFGTRASSAPSPMVTFKFQKLDGMLG